MSPLKCLPLLALAALLAGGCQESASRAWQHLRLPTHDWQCAFDVSQEVLKEHFDIAQASVTKGAIVTKPAVFDRPRSGTLADIRGAGGRWRRTVTLELSRGGLDVDARAAVILEREGTNAAVAITQSGGYEEQTVDVPRSRVYGTDRGGAPPPVWVEVGSDDALAREILSKIAQRLEGLEKQETMPSTSSSRQALEETQKLGAELNR
jgi:hypothetical protein